MANSKIPSARILSVHIRLPIATSHSPLSHMGVSKSRKRCLRPVMQQRIGHPGTQRPEKKASRPVLLEIKNLPRKENPRAQRDRTDGMDVVERTEKRSAVNALPREKAQPAARRARSAPRRQRVPVCRDKQKHARAQKQSAETDCQPHRPAEPWVFSCPAS